jgi:hypothetical protein
MNRPDSISVAWPPTGLGEPGWRTRLECLATRSEALIGKHCRLSDTAGLALELVGLLWPVLGAPETVAATCRASLLVGAPGVVAASSAADQLAEVHSRLDEIWQAAQEDPAAGVVELHPPLLIEVKPVPYELAGKVKPEALVEPEPDELPAAWQPAPLPVTIEPTAPAPTPEAAADAAALLELVGGDAGTLAALRELLACGPVEAAV